MLKRKDKQLYKLGGLMVCILLLGVQACTSPIEVGPDFLKEPPTLDVTVDSVFSKADLAKEFLWNAYYTLPWGPGWVNGTYDPTQMYRNPLASITDLNRACDDAGGAQTYYYNGAYSATVEANRPAYTKYSYKDSGNWEGIRKSYIFINHVDEVPNMSEPTKKRLKAEARMIIATHYIEMFRNLGGVPWVTHAYAPNEDFSLKRATAMATLDSTLATINKAIPHLPFTLENETRWAGRFTKAGAIGLKVRLLLFAASPLFNSNKPYMEGKAAAKKLVWYGEKHPELWAKVAEAARKFFKLNQKNGKPYHLIDTDNPRQDFTNGYFSRGSPEMLIGTRANNYGPGFPNDAQRRGYMSPTDNYVKMFPMKNGLPITAPNSGYDPKHPYENRDPRLRATVLLPGTPFQGRTAEMWIGGRERKNKNSNVACTGYQAYKFILDIESAENHVLVFPYLRLSEIYLSYAEALNEINNGPTAEAYKYVNKVRNRVGIEDLQNGMSQKEFRHAVLRERALELGYEEVRWYDMIRWKMKDVFTETLYGMNICKKQGPQASPPGACPNKGVGYHESEEFIYARFKLPTRSWKKNWSQKWYLSAFPRDEVLKGNIIQNPGW